MFAGFSGVVSVLGARTAGEWRAADRLRFVFLLEASLSAFFLCLLPLAVSQFTSSEAASWAICSSLFAAAVLSGSIAASFRIAHLDPASRAELGRRSVLVTRGLDLIAFALQVANVLGPRRFALYFLGVSWLLGSASLQFVRLVLVRQRGET